MSWRHRAQAKREALNKAIPAEWHLSEVPSVESLPCAVEYVASYMTPEERRITDLSFETLRAALQTGQLTSRQVTLAFAHRAALAHQLTNCLTEFELEAALKRADQLDAHLKETGRPVGPLHGMPISLKDTYYLEGTYATVGFVSWLDKKASREDEAGVVAILREAGAVFYVKTNVPTSMLCAETVNNVYGFTKNAHHRACSAAGSSGGEGSLLSLRGSPLGMGSDIGGSIRLPSCVAGVWGLKCTPGRFPTQGTRSVNKGQTLVPGVVGPMAASVAALEVCAKILLAAQPWLVDPSVVEMPWQMYELPSKLVFGLMISDGIVHPQPPIEHALREVAHSLECAGHEIIPFEPPSHAQALALWLGIMTQSGGEEIHRAIEEGGETLIDEVAQIFGAHKGDRKAMSIQEVYDQAVVLKQYCTAYEQAWTDTARHTRSGRMMDGILMPNSGVVCWRRGQTTYAGFTPPANVLHYCAVSMPLAVAEPIPARPRCDFISRLDEEVYRAYDPEQARGMPIGIQLMARRFQEEKVLAMARTIAATYTPKSPL